MRARYVRKQLLSGKPMSYITMQTILPGLPIEFPLMPGSRMHLQRCVIPDLRAMCKGTMTFMFSRWGAQLVGQHSPRVCAKNPGPIRSKLMSFQMKINIESDTCAHRALFLLTLNLHASTHCIVCSRSDAVCDIQCTIHISLDQQHH